MNFRQNAKMPNAISFFHQLWKWRNGILAFKESQYDYNGECFVVR